MILYVCYPSLLSNLNIIFLLKGTSEIFCCEATQHLTQYVCMSVCLSVCLLVCMFACQSVCLSVCRSVPNFVANFFYIFEEVNEMDELDEGNISAAAGNKINNRWLSLAVPHSDLSTTLKSFILGVSSWILML